MIKLGIIGFGYWGPNIVRNFLNNHENTIVKICDVSEKRLNVVTASYPGMPVTTDPMEIINDPAIDAVAIVTPVYTHYDLAKNALEKGKHVFIEKPFTSTSKQAEELITLADKKGLLIMVDHTFLFTGSVMKMKELIDNGTLGNLYYYDSVRVNLGLFQHDINVIWDLAPHDISIMNYLVGLKPVSVSANGACHVGNGLEDVAYLFVKYENNFIAHFHCNWLSPVKIRKTLVAGDKKMLVWDDLEQDTKIKIFDSGVEVKNIEEIYKLLVQYRTGEMYTPRVESIEALKTETEYFINCIKSGNLHPFNDGNAGLAVVKILEASDISIKNGGKEVLI